MDAVRNGYVHARPVANVRRRAHTVPAAKLKPECAYFRPIRNETDAAPCCMARGVRAILMRFKG